ncbi:MAG TPA: hypothetical protein DCL73_04415 [Treponema sp.]|nr:hypothetical protein [Treponema sp.]
MPVIPLTVMEPFVPLTTERAVLFEVLPERSSSIEHDVTDKMQSSESAATVKCFIENPPYLSSFIFTPFFQKEKNTFFQQGVFFSVSFKKTAA